MLGLHRRFAYPRAMLLMDGLIIAGLINAVLLAVVSAVAARRDRRWAWLSALFCLMLVSFICILLTHRSNGIVERIAASIEQVAWAVGPAMYAYMRLSLGYPLSGRQAAAHFIIPVMVLTAGTIFIMVRGAELLSTEILVAQQILYTAASATLFLNRPDKADRSDLGFWWPAAILAVVASIHVAQLLRLSPWGQQMQDIVPLIGSLGTVAVLLILLILAQRAPKTQTRYSKSALSHHMAQTIFQNALSRIEQEGWYRQRDLALGDVAMRVGVGVHHLSQSISVAGNTSFNELLGMLRVNEAKRLLLDPRNLAVAVEPLGMEAGFRSRSAFYAAFREKTGQTPNEFRNLHSCPAR